MESWGDTQRIEVPEQVSGRADKVLAQLVSGVSRTRIQQSFDAGRVWRDGQKIAKRERVGPRDLIEVQLIKSFESTLEPVELPLNILFEDEHLLFVDKEPGMVVHPGVGTGSETLVHALLHYCERVLVRLVQWDDQALYIVWTRLHYCEDIRCHGSREDSGSLSWACSTI